MVAATPWPQQKHNTTSHAPWNTRCWRCSRRYPARSSLHAPCSSVQPPAALAIQAPSVSPSRCPTSASSLVMHVLSLRSRAITSHVCAIAALTHYLVMRCRSPPYRPPPLTLCLLDMRERRVPSPLGTSLPHALAPSSALMQVEQIKRSANAL